MTKRSNKRKGLGFAPDRWTVFSVGGMANRGACSRRTYTSYGDAAKATLRCSKRGKVKQPCFLLEGYASGPTRVIGRCQASKCGPAKPSDKNVIAACAEKTSAAKKARLKEIVALMKKREDRKYADRARGIGPSKATPTRTGTIDGARKRR